MSIQPSPIVCLSLNPAIDLTYEITHLQHDQKTRAIKTCYHPGGTGINVGRALAQLNIDATTCYTSGGKLGKFLDQLIARELNNTFRLEVDGETRINTTLVQQSSHSQYEINAKGTAITPVQLNAICQQFLTRCKHGIGILTGSLCPGLPLSTYADLVTKMKAQGGRAIVDAPANILAATLNSQPFLIKPNRYELAQLSGKELNTLDDIIVEARKIVTQGIRYVCVSLAAQGALLVDRQDSYYCGLPRIKVDSTVGAGDSLVAGLAYGFAKNKPPAEVLKWATACGACSSQHPGTALFELHEVILLADKLTVESKMI